MNNKIWIIILILCIFFIIHTIYNDIQTGRLVCSIGGGIVFLVCACIIYLRIKNNQLK